MGWADTVTCLVQLNHGYTLGDFASFHYNFLQTVLKPCTHGSWRLDSRLRVRLEVTVRDVHKRLWWWRHGVQLRNLVLGTLTESAPSPPQPGFSIIWHGRVSDYLAGFGLTGRAGFRINWQVSDYLAGFRIIWQGRVSDYLAGFPVIWQDFRLYDPNLPKKVGV